MLCLDDTYHFSHFLLLLHWIKKWSSRGRLLEHLESSGRAYYNSHGID